MERRPGGGGRLWPLDSLLQGSHHLVDGDGLSARIGVLPRPFDQATDTDGRRKPSAIPADGSSG